MDEMSYEDRVEQAVFYYKARREERQIDNYRKDHESKQESSDHQH